MSKKYIIEEVREFIGEIGYDLISEEYISNSSKLIFKDKGGYFYFASFYSLKDKHIPSKFGNGNPYTIQNIKLWCKLNNKPFELLDNQIYESNNKYLEWKCLRKDCQEIFKMNWNNIYTGQSCGYCTGQRVGLSNCLATKNPELAKEWHFIKNKNITPYNILPRSGKKVWWKCKECGHEWEASVDKRSKNRGCPECNESKGEKKISNYLTYNRIEYTPQKTFKSLVGLGNGLLSYDFYLPQYNLLIEYQGEQHERYIKGLHKSKKDFEKQVEHDRRKREYANENNIKVLEIWYYDFNEIEEILESKLGEISQQDGSFYI